RTWPGPGMLGPMWDVAVVGSGPAGATAAIAARRAWPQARVLLLDRADFPRDKSCGDGVAPHVLDVLERLGVTGLLADWPSVQRLRLCFPEGPEIGGVMRRGVYVVPRTVLDTRIRAAALDRGVEAVRHRVRRVEVAPDRVVLDDRLEARVVVGADGAHSVVRSAIGADPASARQAIALRAYAPVIGLPSDEQLIVFERDARWPAYAWSFPIGDGRANVGYGEFLPPGGKGRTPTRAQLVRRLHELLPGLRDPTALRGHHLPLSTAAVRQPDGPVLLAGDALSLINPLTGEGIHTAVLTGALAGIAAARAARSAATGSGRSGAGPDPGRELRRALRGAFGRHTRDVNAMAHFARPRAVAAGLRGAQGRQRVFDDLVELGLADGRITRRLLGVIVAELVRRAGRPFVAGPPGPGASAEGGGPGVGVPWSAEAMP
ncbi:MAG TPA: geranylgeranyl reductase family protein, partial [Kineosporiaceae bacterium]